VASYIQNDRQLKDIPVIFLTATVSRREAGPGGLKSGGSLYLAKPVSLENLIACINEYVRKPAAAEQPAK
jgi:DNA-binding response OmpR family regulator